MAKVNVELFRKIQKLFREKPSKSYMRWFGLIKSRYRNKFKIGSEVPICKTHLCIAGSAIVLSGAAKMVAIDGTHIVNFISTKTGHAIDPWGLAKKELGITEKQAGTLFRESFWPDQFKSFTNDTGSRTLASNMVKRIDYFLKTGI